MLFRDVSWPELVVGPSPGLVTPDDNVYWVTVGKGRQDNFEIGIRNGVWGVPSEYADKLKNVAPGDKIIFYGQAIGFALCDVLSKPYHDSKRIWPDGDYPYRIRITPPLRRNEASDFSSVYRHLVDRFGRPYTSAQAAGRAIGGGGGVFRKLTHKEIAGLLRGLSWHVPLTDHGRRLGDLLLPD